MDTNIQRILLSKTCSIITIITGIAIRCVIDRRRFYRRGVGGLQHYPKYWIAIATIFIEWVFQWVANFLILSGFLLLLVCLDSSKHHYKDVQQNKTIQS